MLSLLFLLSRLFKLACNVSNGTDGPALALEGGRERQESKLGVEC